MWNARTTTTTTTTTSSSMPWIEQQQQQNPAPPPLHVQESLAVMSDMKVEVLENGHEFKWCIFAKDVRGSVGKIVVDTSDETTAKIVAVFVKKEFRGRKLGEMLVQRAARALYANGFLMLELDAEENMEHYGRLVQLYERCGFVVDTTAQVTYEYNGDETFRKVRMKCDLVHAYGGAAMIPPQQEMLVPPPVTTTTSASAASAAAAMPRNNVTNINRHPLALSYEFVSRMRREALELIASCPLNLSVIQALARIEAIHPECFLSSLHSGLFIQARGHPDWLELAGYLRHLGKLQEIWEKWQTPFAVRLQREHHFHHEEEAARGNSDRHVAADDDDDDGERMEMVEEVKSGPLPSFCTTEAEESSVVDAERYAPGCGMDETLLTWSANEFAFLMLDSPRFNSAPCEMVRCLRYCNFLSWLNGVSSLSSSSPEQGMEQLDPISALQNWEDVGVKEWVVTYHTALEKADRAAVEYNRTWPSASELVDASKRRSILVDKYLRGVVCF